MKINLIKAYSQRKKENGKKMRVLMKNILIEYFLIV